MQTFEGTGSRLPRYPQCSGLSFCDHGRKPYHLDVDRAR